MTACAAADVTTHIINSKANLLTDGNLEDIFKNLHVTHFLFSFSVTPCNLIIQLFSFTHTHTQWISINTMKSSDYSRSVSGLIKGTLRND